MGDGWGLMIAVEPTRFNRAAASTIW